SQPTPPSLLAAAPAVLEPRTRPGFRQFITPRVRLALIAIAALTVLAVAGMAIHKSRQPSGPQDRVISLQTFQDCVNKAVKLAETGAEDKAIAGLKDLAKYRTIPERATGRFLLEALENSAKLKTDFASSWEKALDAWERLEHDNATTFQARELARARREAILRESKNLALRDKALAAFGKGDFVEFFKQAAKISPESSALAALADQIRDAKARLAAQQTAKADQNEKSRNWSAAIQDLQLVIEYVPEMKAEIEPRIDKLRGFNLQQDRIAQAGKSLDAGKVAEARSLLDSVPPDGPYASERTAALARAIKIEAERSATAAYDSGDSAKALQILKQAGLGESDLARKAAMVAEQYKIMNDSITQLLFKQADTAAERIIELEKKTNNWYYTKADDYLKNKSAVRTRQAEQFSAQATQAYRQQKYREARDLYEKARALDPRLASASQGIAALKSEAARVFNVEVLAKRDTDPEAALKAAKEVRDRLRPGETFHTQALQIIKELEEKTGK
ncbi:MAG TPA: hypothetical protein P5137_13155, partial [Candidatus Brocadiia bacterium]|nr:hypothetical protein [Candidatus Brocadiia bacterium]